MKKRLQNTRAWADLLINCLISSEVRFRQKLDFVGRIQTYKEIKSARVARFFGGLLASFAIFYSHLGNLLARFFFLLKRLKNGVQSVFYYIFINKFFVFSSTY